MLSYLLVGESEPRCEATQPPQSAGKRNCAFQISLNLVSARALEEYLAQLKALCHIWQPHGHFWLPDIVTKMHEEYFQSRKDEVKLDVPGYN